VAVEPEAFSFLSAPPWPRLLARLGGGWAALSTVDRILLTVAVTWLPPALLSIVEGHFAGPGLSFSRDAAIYVRFLWVLPLLLAGGPLLDRQLSQELRGWRLSGILRAEDIPRFDGLLRRLGGVLTSWSFRAVLSVLAFGLSWIEMRSKVRMAHLAHGAGPAWITSAPGSGVGGLTWAALWYAVVSGPTLYFQILVWLLRFLFWGAILVQLARLRPRTLMAHPDRVAGLGGIARVHEYLAILLLAFSSVEAAGLVNLIVHFGVSPGWAHRQALASAVVALVVFLGPLLVFTPMLLETRLRGLSLYGNVAARHAASLERWMKQACDARAGDDHLEHPVVQQHAHMADSYAVVFETRPVLVGRRLLVLFVIAAFVPTVAVAVMQVPVTQLLERARILFV